MHPISVKKPLAVVTIAQCEPEFLPIWLDYYRPVVSREDCYVLNHDFQPTSAAAAKDRADWRAKLKRASRRATIVPVHNQTAFSHIWLQAVVKSFVDFLLNSYERVVFVEIDELLYPRHLLRTIMPGDDSVDALRVRGYDIVDDGSGPGFGATRFVHAPLWDKPLVVFRPVAWSLGFHALTAGRATYADPSLLLLHLHKANVEVAKRRLARTRNRRWSTFDAQAGYGVQNRYDDGEFYRAQAEAATFGGTLPAEIFNSLPRLARRLIQQRSVDPALLAARGL